jgi:hypothetical protein
MLLIAERLTVLGATNVQHKRLVAVLTIEDRVNETKSDMR